MENIEPEKRNIAELAHDYAETYIQLTVAKVTRKTADISAAASLGLISGLIIFFILMFLGIAASFWVGGLVHSNAGGFLIVSAFYLIVLVILFATRRKLIYPMIRNLIVKSIYD